MKPIAWMLAAPIALAAMTAPGWAQTPMTLPKSALPANDGGVVPAQLLRRWQPAPCQTCPTPELGKPMEPVDPSKLPSSTPETAPTAESTPSFGGYKSSFGQGTPISAASGIGGAVASAAAGLPIPQANAKTATVTTNATPLIMPGLLTAATSQNATPLDRVFFDFGYFNRFAISSPTGAVPGFNLNQFNVGVEKTILNGNASVYAIVPFLYATSNISGQSIDGLGDVSAGFKFVLWRNLDTGSIWSAGMTVAAPTARATTVTNTLNVTFTGGTQPAVVPNPPPVGTILPFSITARINPTYLQPYAAGMWVLDRFFIHEYFGVLIPTDDRVSTLINNNVTMGYNIYSNPYASVSSITPVFGVQALLPVNHISNSVSPTTTTVASNIPCIGPYPTDQLPNLNSFGFPTQIFLSAGAQIGLGQRCLFSAGVVVPVAGPRGYQVGATAGLSYFY
jgi:hypothetical protein